MFSTPYAVDLAGEMDRYISGRLGWTTTLLTHSTIGLLRELLLAGREVGSVLSEASFSDLNDQVIEQILIDPGIGDRVTRGILRAKLPKRSDDFVARSHKYQAIETILEELESRYLRNWLSEFSAPEYLTPNHRDIASLVPAKYAAALLSAFLLDVGFSREHLVRWLDYRIKHDTSPISLEDFIASLVEKYERGKGPLEIMVAVDRPVAPASRSIDGWLNAERVKGWLTSNGFSAPRTVHGGILYVTEQWDIYGALENVRTSLQRIRHRAALKSGKPPSFNSIAWIKGVTTPRKIPGPMDIGASVPGYSIDVPSLESPSSDNRLEVAVEFLQAAYLVGGPGAVGTLWASIEALLSAPGDPERIEVANRGADIALVTFVRSELLMSIGLLLSRGRSEVLGQEIAALDFNGRLPRLREVLLNGEFEALPPSGLRIQLEHAADLLQLTYTGQLRISMRRSLTGLYRQRNLVLHGGITDGPLLPAYLRLGFPIVSAIVNRYARAIEARHVDPQVFAFETYVAVEQYVQRAGDVFDFMN